MKLATFRGGYLDKTSRWIPEGDVYLFHEPAELEAMLEASIKVYQQGMAVVPPEKIAVYRLGEDGFYHMEGYQ